MRSGFLMSTPTLGTVLLLMMRASLFRLLPVIFACGRVLSWTQNVNKTADEVSSPWRSLFITSSIGIVATTSEGWEQKWNSQGIDVDLWLVFRARFMSPQVWKRDYEIQRTCQTPHTFQCPAHIAKPEDHWMADRNTWLRTQQQTTATETRRRTTAENKDHQRCK